MTDTATKPSGSHPPRGVLRWGAIFGEPLKPRRNPSTGFDQMAAPIPLAELYAMFSHKAAWSTVRNWRRGHRQAPPWAYDMLRNRLENDARKLLELAAMGERAKKEGR